MNAFAAPLRISTRCRPGLRARIGACGSRRVADPNLSGPWPRPDIRHLSGRYVQVARLDAAADIEDLYDVSHRTEEFRVLWRYLWNGPFEGKDAMYRWLDAVADGANPKAQIKTPAVPIAMKATASRLLGLWPPGPCPLPLPDCVKVTASFPPIFASNYLTVQPGMF